MKELFLGRYLFLISWVFCICSTAFKSSCWSLKNTKVPNTIFQPSSSKKCLKAIWLKEEAETFTIRWPSQLQKFASQASALYCYLQKLNLSGLKIIFSNNKNYWLWLVVTENFLGNNFKPWLRYQFVCGTNQDSVLVSSQEAPRRPILYRVSISCLSKQREKKKKPL